MPFYEEKYKYNIGILKNYNDRKLKLSVHTVLRTKGLETPSQINKKGSVNDSKLDVNITRARSKIFEYAMCNDWDLWCTFTINEKKYNRNDLELYHKNMAQFIRDYNKKNNLNIKYLLIPEEHKKGGWHEHGFIYGLPINHLRKFTLEENLPKYIREKLLFGQDVFEWVNYRNRFGWCDIEIIRNSEAAAKYVTKYITKALAVNVTQLNAHLYYCSKGLKTACEIKRGTMLCDIVPDWENEWVKVQWFTDTQNLESLKNLIK